jgi:hypothetical protein
MWMHKIVFDTIKLPGMASPDCTGIAALSIERLGISKCRMSTFNIRWSRWKSIKMSE